MHMMHTDDDHSAPGRPTPPEHPPKPWPEWDSPLLFMLGPNLDSIP